VKRLATDAKNIRSESFRLERGMILPRTLGCRVRSKTTSTFFVGQKQSESDLVRVKSKRARYFVNVSAGGFSGMVDEKLTTKESSGHGTSSLTSGVRPLCGCRS